VSDMQRSENRGMSSLVLPAGTTVDIVADQCDTSVMGKRVPAPSALCGASNVQDIATN
jgi:hypothetical protein